MKYTLIEEKDGFLTLYFDDKFCERDEDIYDIKTDQVVVFFIVDTEA